MSLHASAPLRVLIVDDEAPARARLRTLLGDLTLACPTSVVGEASNGKEALALAAQQQPDLILLDIQMPGMDGMALAQALAARAPAPALVFVTAFEQHAIHAFEVRAADYLLKPVRASRLAEALKRVAPGLARPTVDEERYFSVQERGRLLRVAARDVLYLKAEQKYTLLHTTDARYWIELSLSAVEEDMPELFVRIHRNAVVARAAIAGVEKALVAEGDADADKEGWVLLLHGTQEKLPVSRRQWPVIKALLRA